MIRDNRVIGCFAVTVHTVTEINTNILLRNGMKQQSQVIELTATRFI